MRIAKERCTNVDLSRLIGRSIPCSFDSIRLDSTQALPDRWNGRARAKCFCWWATDRWRQGARRCHWARECNLYSGEQRRESIIRPVVAPTDACFGRRSLPLSDTLQAIVRRCVDRVSSAPKVTIVRNQARCLPLSLQVKWLTANQLDRSSPS